MEENKYKTGKSRPSHYRTSDGNAQTPQKGRYLSDEARERMRKERRRKARIRRRLQMGILIAILILIIGVIVALFLGGGDDLKGTWSLDDVTVYQFDGNGSGAMILPNSTYDFDYKINENEVSIDFESEKARDFTYTFSVEKNTLTLVGGEGNEDVTYNLTRQK